MKRSKHSLSHFRNLSCDQGQLVPIGYTEVLPGDTFQHATSLLVRTSPLVTPVMHPVHVRVHHWFVPFRLIWTNFQNFITGGLDGNDATVAPYVTINTANDPWKTYGQLSDHLGVPPAVGNGLTVSALPFRAYQLIFREWYQDQDLVTPPTISLGDGADTTTTLTLQNVAWEKDYFTSSRPWTQKGPAVSMPLAGQATVNMSGSALLTGAQNPVSWKDSVTGNSPAASVALGTGAGAGANQMFITGTAIAQGGNGLYPQNLYADLSTSTGPAINQLRHALAIQRYEEARARYGARYTEYLRYLGVRSSDARLQRPEYLGGGKQTIQFSEVLQTAPTTSGTPVTGVGAMQGHGIGAVRSNRYRRFFEEHGCVITMLSVLPKTMYVNGLPKWWSKTTKEDFWQKELEHIGQQAVLNKEAYLAHSSPAGTFGYQDRYDEYRRQESTVHGLFRTTLNTWHMGRIFSSDPSLNSTFVQAAPTTRIYQATSGNDTMLIMAMHSIQARRMVAKIGTSSIF